MLLFSIFMSLLTGAFALGYYVGWTIAMNKCKKPKGKAVKLNIVEDEKP